MKEITLESYLNQTDKDPNVIIKTLNSLDPNSLGGVLNFYDMETLGFLMQKRNSVMLRGRAFALENLFKRPVSNANAQFSNRYNPSFADRALNFFSVGSGGAASNDIFSTLPNSPISESLNAPLPFQTVGNGITLTAVDATSYVNPISDSNGNTSYYGKQFENRTPSIIVDKADNRVFCKLDLVISPADLRNKVINELGLYFSTPTFTNAELYSKVHFMSEPLSGSKGLIIEYYTFA